MSPQEQVSIRTLLHNFSECLDKSKSYPLEITKRGNVEAILINPSAFQERQPTPVSIGTLLALPFIGCKKGEKSERTNAELASQLREKAWYGSDNSR